MLITIVTSASTKDFFVDAVNFTTTVPFKSTKSFFFDKEQEINFYGQNGFWRMEVFGPSNHRFFYYLGPVSSEIRCIKWVEAENKKGKILKNTVICDTRPMQTFIEFLLDQVTEKRMKGASYSVLYSDDKMMKLSVKYPTDKKYIANLSAINFYRNYLDIIAMEDEDKFFFRNGMSQELYEKFEDKVLIAYYASVVYYISKSFQKPFIYGYQAYSMKGDKLYEYFFKDPIVCNAFPDDFFKQPQNTKTILVSTSREYAETYFKTFGSGWRDPTPSAFQSFWIKHYPYIIAKLNVKLDKFMYYSDFIFGIIGLLSIGTILILKKRNQKNKQ